MGKLAYWNLNRWIIVGLLFAFGGLMVDLRFEHNHVVDRNAIAWTPIIYSGTMVLGVLVGLAFWEKLGRKALQILFLAGIFIGLWGFYLHNDGHIVQAIVTLISPWFGKHPDPEDGPPVMAPLAYAGLGAFGWALCLSRFQAPPPQPISR